MKGGSSSEALDRGTAAFHLALAVLHTRVWFEYIESEANWSDSASRRLFDDPWCKANGFDLKALTVPSWVWTVEYSDLRSQVVQALPK